MIKNGLMLSFTNHANHRVSLPVFVCAVLLTHRLFVYCSLFLCVRMLFVYVVHMLSQWLCKILCYAEPVVVNHGVLFWASGCESWCVILSLWFWIMVSYDGSVVVNHGVLFWASGCESWCVILSKWLWIIVCYAKPCGCEWWCIMLSKMVVNHDVLSWAQWLGIMMCYAEPMVRNHGLLCCVSGCESWFVLLSQWLWIMVYHAEPVVVNHALSC
jgi:hypothetical protein